MAILSVSCGTEQPLAVVASTAQSPGTSSKILFSESGDQITVCLPVEMSYYDQNFQIKKAKEVKASQPKASAKNEHSKKWCPPEKRPKAPILVSKVPISFPKVPPVVNLPPIVTLPPVVKLPAVVKVAAVVKPPPAIELPPVVEALPLKLAVTPTVAKANHPASKAKRGKWAVLPLKSSGTDQQSGPVLGSDANWVLAATPKFASGAFTRSAYQANTNPGSGWAKVATTAPGANNPTEEDFPELRSRQSGDKKPSVLSTQSAPKVQSQPSNAEKFPIDHFPSLGAQSPQKKSWQIPDQRNILHVWEPEVWALEGAVSYVPKKTAEEIAFEKKSAEGWMQLRKQFLAEERAVKLAREEKRQTAKENAENLRTWGKKQFRLPPELWIQVLLDLDSNDRKSFLLTCSDARDILAELVTVWDVTKGDFEESVKESQAPIGSGGVPTTAHSVTIVKPDSWHEQKNHIGHETLMIKKLSIGLYHMADHFRHLELHKVPLLNLALLTRLIPTLNNLEYLGIFHCVLFNVSHTESLLQRIQSGGQHRKKEVELDFYPSTSLIYYKKITFSSAIPALLYRILPKAAAQNAQLMKPGRAFPQWLRDCHVQLSDDVLGAIEQNVQDASVLREVGTGKYGGKKTEFPPDSIDARQVECQSCHLRLLGCFFSAAEVQGTSTLHARCWGCRLVDEIVLEESHEWALRDQQEAVGEGGWLKPAVGVERMVRIAREHVEKAAAAIQKKGNTPPMKKDITFSQKLRDREYQLELQQLIKKGVLQPGATRIPGKYAWGTSEKSSRYNCSYKEYIEPF
ncbi:MAG: hypothetical protein M1816_001464 [Peltula sp. TS41687]|nr:MAG: hypothetical protein M1816_001464 [Peltula sp. TS41687]